MESKWRCGFKITRYFAYLQQLYPLFGDAPAFMFSRIGFPVKRPKQCTTSLLNAFDKVLERVVFKHLIYLYNHFRDNNILIPLQSGFIPKDSIINQLTFLYDKLCQALDNGKKVRVVFCDISKAFDRVWHAGLLCKLEALGISGSLLSWFSSYLSNRRQRVTLPGVYSDWKYIKAGVPQGSIKGTFSFFCI